MNTRRARVLLASLATLASCGPALHPLPADPIRDPGVLLSRAAARRASLPVLNAVARVESWSEAGGVKGRTTILVDPAGRLRVDAWSPTDDLVGAVSADARSFRYFERGAPECLAGAPCPENLGRVLPLGLGLADACAALYGMPPMPPPGGAADVAFDRRTGAYLVTAAGPGGPQRLWIRDDGVVVRAELAGPSGAALTMEADDVHDVGGVPFAFRLHFAAEPGGRDVTVRYKSVELGAEVAADGWAVECPPGMPTRDLPCGGGE
jgi:hypothetical protein